MKSLLLLKPYILRYRWRLVLGIIFVLLTNLIAVRVPPLVGDALEHARRTHSSSSELGAFAAYLLTLACLAGAFRYLMRRVLIDTSRDIEYDYRNDFFSHLERLDATFYDGHNTGDLMSRATNDIDNVRNVIGPAIMYTCNTVFSLPLLLAQMLHENVLTTLSALAPMIFMPIVVRHFGAQLHRSSRAQQDQLGEMTTFVQEHLAGIRVIKAYAQEDSERERFRNENENFIERSMELARVQALFMPAIRFIVGFGFLAILGVGSLQINAHRMEVGTLISLTMLFTMLVWPLIAIGWVINLYQRGAASLARLDEILHAKPAVPAAVDNGQRTMDNGQRGVEGGLAVEFRHLDFRYEGSERKALADIDISIPAGRIIGIVGPVGCGKSTLVHLLARLYPVASGQLFLGGRDINDWPVAEIRRHIALVFQETFLFSDTIEENIQFGALDRLSPEDIDRVTRQANLHDEVLRFPKGLQTELGERGINLSGGQRQRLSLARALVRDASILILDDALSAVDTHTEEAILGELRQAMKGRTVFLISHRISTVSVADEILVLDAGRIIQRGSHEELIEQPGLYAEIHQRQLLEQEVEAID